MESNKNRALLFIEEASANAAKSFGLCIWGVDLLNQNGRFLARIFVDADQSQTENISSENTQSSTETPSEDSTSQSGVNIDQCARISRMVGLAMEVEDVFTDAWILEVSSPGLDRRFFKLEQLQTYINYTIEVLIEEPLENFSIRRKFRGQLQSVGEENFTLILESPEGEACPIEWSNVRKAHLIHIFPDTTAPKNRGKV